MWVLICLQLLNVKIMSKKSNRSLSVSAELGIFFWSINDLRMKLINLFKTRMFLSMSIKKCNDYTV